MLMGICDCSAALIIKEMSEPQLGVSTQAVELTQS